MFRITVLVFLLIFAAIPLRAADDLTWLDEEFKQNNPDGNKYEFVKSYIMSLEYIYSIQRRIDNLDEVVYKNYQDQEKTQYLIDEILKDNLNLRVARNLLNKFKSQPNNLILKTADLFVRFCDEQIELNNTELAMLKEMFESQSQGKSEAFDFEGLVKKQQELASQRKASMSKLLETSMLINKVLVSNKNDPYSGKAVIGITQEQRKQLIARLRSFEGDQFSGELREGQSFLEASIVTIRNFLEDYSWDTLDS